MSRTTWVVVAFAVSSLLASAAARAAPADDQQIAPCVGADGKASGFRYPVQAQKARREGSVELRVQVDDSGHASKVVVSSSSGSPDLDKAARVAARNASFCRLDGHTPAAPGLAQMRVDFRMDQLVAER